MIQPKNWPKAVVKADLQSSARPSSKEQPKGAVSSNECAARPSAKGQPTAVVTAIDA